MFKYFAKFKFLSFIGKYTVVILALQLIALAAIKLFFMLFLKYEDFKFSEIEKFIISIVQIIILIPSFYLVNKYIPIANGTNKK